MVVASKPTTIPTRRTNVKLEKPVKGMMYTERRRLFFEGVANCQSTPIPAGSWDSDMYNFTPIFGNKSGMSYPGPDGTKVPCDDIMRVCYANKSFQDGYFIRFDIGRKYLSVTGDYVVDMSNALYLMMVMQKHGIVMFHNGEETEKTNLPVESKFCYHFASYQYKLKYNTLYNRFNDGANIPNLASNHDYFYKTSIEELSKMRSAPHYDQVEKKIVSFVSHNIFLCV